MPLYLGTDDAGTSSFSLQDFEPSWATKMNAAVRESWLESYGPAVTDFARSRMGDNTAPKLSAIEAADAIKQSGLKFPKKIGDGQYTRTQLDVLLDRQRELTAVKDVRERTPWDASSALRGVGMFGAGIMDPINLATAFVPWTKSLSVLNGARAGLMAESFATRTASRALIGGADAGISTALLEPAYSFVRTQIGDDYSALDSLANIAFGTAFGGGLHTIGGAVGDVFRSRAVGQPMVTPDPMREVQAPPAGMMTGGETRIRIGETYEPARWSVVDADQLTATVDKADNQFRDRTRAAYQTEIQQRANNLDFNLLADSPVMDYGAPTLAADGRIIGGNGRALFISRAYEIGKGGDYKAALEARLADLGLDPDSVRGMVKPVLVRVLQREVDVKRAAMLSNEGGSTDMSPLEQAKVDAERLGDTRLNVGLDGDLNAPENRSAVRAWVQAQPENKRNSLIDEDGRLSANGMQRLNAALLYKAYGDSPTLGRLIESMDPGSRNLVLALGRTAPVIANARAAIASGDLHPLDIAGDIQQAVEQFNTLREAGTRVPDYLAQMDAFGDGLTPEALALLDFVGRNVGSPRRMAEAINGFYDLLDQAGNPKQGDIFGGAAVPDKAALLAEALARAEQGMDSAAEVAAMVSPETREATLRASVAQSVDGRDVDVDAIIGMDETQGTATLADASEAADRTYQPENVATADFEASAAVQARVDAAPKWDGVKDAEAALAEADAVLTDTVAAGDQAFKYSRGEAPGQKKATLWQGTTARFAPEDGKPLGGFRWDFINSDGGEQAQAFGYGHYLAQQAWISQTRYRERLIGRRKDSLDSFAIPDGVGGVMTISRRNNETPWQLPDGTIVHASQKDPAMAAKAAAIAQVEAYGYARSRETFENLLKANRKFVAERFQRMDDFVAGLDDPAERAEWTAKYAKTRADLQAELDADAARLAALDEVTVDPGKLWEVFDPRDGVAVARFATEAEAKVDAATRGQLFDYSERDNELAPGIQKYDPPKPENLRERVMAGGQEITDELADSVRSVLAMDEDGYFSNPLIETIGRNLQVRAAELEGANAVLNINAMIDVLEGAGPGVDADPIIAQLRDLQARGTEFITIEKPGSLYRAEMEGADFENLMLWDAPMSEQPAKVRDAFAKWGIVDQGPPKPPPIGELLAKYKYTINEAPAGSPAAWQLTFKDGSSAFYPTREIAESVLVREWAADTGADSYVPLTGEASYGRLMRDIDRGDLNDELADAVMSAHFEIARRRFGRNIDDSVDPMEMMDDAGYVPGSDEVASVVLSDAGIPGHAFLDGVSRGAADAPAYNIVIYSDDVARVVDRYARQTGEIGRATDTPEGLTEALRLSFGKSTEALLDAGMVRLVGTPADIPGGPHPADVKGATAPDGTVYIVAQNVSEVEAKGMLLHEVGVHVGMERMLGPDVFQSVLRELDDAVARGEEWAQAARSRVPADTPAGLVREEQLAYLVQFSPDLPIVQRIIAAVRAWAYRTFEFARDRMALTEADFRAMAVSALHEAAKGEPVQVGGLVPDVSYARGETPDPSTTADEMKPYDDAVARAKSYAKVLRAAADKLDNDAQATAAMKAALPDLSPVEITDLLDGLRKQVKGLRGVARKARDAMRSEDVAAGLQFEAMQAADELANNLEMAAVIEKRNASLNMAARLKATAYVNQFRDAGLDFEGFRGLLVGTERKRAGGRISVDAEQKNFRGEWIGGMIADLEKEGLMGHFSSGEFDRDISVAMWNLGKGEPAGNVAPEAVKIAEVVSKYQTDARNTRNRFGSWIRDLQGYITRQSHDMFKIRDAGEKAFKEFVLPRLDVKKSLRDFDGTVDDFLTRVYDDFAAGSHMKTVAGEVETIALGTGSSLAKRESVSRQLYFKDGNASFEYNEKFGQGRLAESVLQGLDQAGKSAGLLKLLGTNPEATITRVFNEYAESLRGDPDRRSKFLSHKKELENLLATVDGSSQIPGNVTAARISSFLRSWQTMAKLGGMLISSITDLANYAAELRFGQDKNLLSGTMESIGALSQGRAAGEKKAILASLGVFHESTLGSVYARFDSPDLVGGKMAAAMQQFFKLSGINWWTESLRDGYALSHANYLASNAGKAFDKLPDALRDLLGLYNIDAGKWDVLRIATMQEADGRSYMTPEGLKTVPVAALENYITSIGRTVSDASILNLQDDLSSALRTMTIDRMHHAVLEPGARTRAFMLRGTQPGTVPGELLRFITQFKSFPVALIQSTLGREVYGRGYDTISDYIKRGKGDMVGLASFIALSTAMGYAAMSVKDLIKGRNPRPVDDPRTWAAAMVQGGGLGLYGDFLFGKYNRMGGTLTGSLAGPVANLADTAADLWTRIRTGDDVAAAAFTAALQNTPFANLFYARVALDYLVLYRIQEALNPGFLRRMEKRAERDNGQTFYLPPSSVAQ